MEKDTTSVQNLIDLFDDEMENATVLTDPVRDQLAQTVSDHSDYTLKGVVEHYLRNLKQLLGSYL